MIKMYDHILISTQVDIYEAYDSTFVAYQTDLYQLIVPNGHLLVPWNGLSTEQVVQIQNRSWLMFHPMNLHETEEKCIFCCKSANTANCLRITLQGTLQSIIMYILP